MVTRVVAVKKLFITTVLYKYFMDIVFAQYADIFVHMSNDVIVSFIINRVTAPDS